ncbi:hypothetical protein BKA70DRAFT_1257083 [Coprinopsis sp. MPI-PUGE-AT-0042]|nr:hypothetical protein BKA70DRAFT_1257083 [Coprinopsis sp. MPI-PUGE-AT-0042]
MLLPPTPFQTRLGTNYAPSEKEITQIKQILDQVDSISTQIDTEMEALKAKQAVCSAFAAAHRVLLSPIRRVPSDILINIFLLCLDLNEQRRMISSQPPLLLTSICHQWREVAVGAPSLWGSIRICIPPYPNVFGLDNSYFTNVLNKEGQEWRDVEDAAEAAIALEREREDWEKRVRRKTHLARLWLDRGRECPLSIALTIECCGSEEGEDTVAEIIALICTHVSRWKHFYLLCNLPVPKRILSLKASQAIQLCTLSMSWKEGGQAHYLNLDAAIPGSERTLPSFPPDGITNAPTLRQLSFKDYPAGPILPMPVQWATLTEFLFCGFPSRPEHPGMSPALALAFLHECPGLVKCKMHFMYETAQVTSNVGLGSPRRVLLRHLQRLIVHEDVAHSSHMFFDSLDTPTLQSLSLSTSGAIRYQGPNPLDPEPSAISFLKRWGDRIRELEFGRCALTVTDLVKCTQLTPHVEDLAINLQSVKAHHTHFEYPWRHDLSFFKNDFLKKFEAGTADGTLPLCPNLRSVKFTMTHCMEVAAKVVVRLGNSRRQKIAGVGGLEIIIVRFATSGGAGRWDEQQWSPPSRWQESTLNAGLGGQTIRVEWPKINGALHLPHLPAPISGDRAHDPFQSWWDSESTHYSSHPIA